MFVVREYLKLGRVSCGWLLGMMAVLVVEEVNSY